MTELPDTSVRYFNRELSWLAFNRRVMEEATNPAHPLLERLRFLSISGSNFDEFFMVRVAGLMGQQLQKVETRSVDGLTPGQQLDAISAEAEALADNQQAVWTSIRADLLETDIHVLDANAIEGETEAWLETHFRDQIFPILTPQALDPAHPFPFIPNQGSSVIFDLVRKSDREPVRELVLLPTAIKRFVRLPGNPARYVAVEAVLKHFSHLLFPGYESRGAAAFRVLRDSDIEIEEEAEDLVLTFRSAIKRRRRGRVIRLEMEESISPELEAVLKEELGGSEALLTETGGFLGIGDLAMLVDEDRPDLKFTPYTPRFPERIREYGGDCFAAIKAKDIVVHHPYESFDVVISFLQQAASDPDVVAIKQTLYRAGKQPAVINALIAAAEAGKSVTAVVELKARFDEEQNLYWATALERAGVQVVYGFIDWKTHAKVSMVVRREGNGYRTYCHFGTGNYHPITARIYTDISFFTADPRVGRDAAQIFNYVTGYVEPHGLELIGISPRDLRNRLVGLIDDEIAHARAGRPGQLWAKMNSLVDPAVIEKLYEASNAGVEIELVIRGICCLRPGVPGMSENIKVKSIVGRFLEHSRIWAFGNGKALPNDGAKVYISSADWMQRNFDRRVEFMLPILNKTVHDQVLDQVMVANLLDNEQSWVLGSDGHYTRITPGEDANFNLHRYFMTNPSLSGRGAALDARKPVPKLQLKRKARTRAKA
ncbi:RNA degradosome polyphosphate kinase [Sphingomonas sp. NIBR02145]|nr:RNA degradosome polyphosphate kinase [Sphingomonas sp. NIBR02145]WHU03935.1 RNA degradosome polyphosphate kinase [Sphingomonas sp. NIBR02145]